LEARVKKRTFGTCKNEELSQVPWNSRESFKLTVCDTAGIYTANFQLSTLPNFGIDERKIEKNKRLFEVMNF
jgi:hypothetical protein